MNGGSRDGLTIARVRGNTGEVRGHSGSDGLMTDWPSLFTLARKHLPQAVIAETFLDRFGTASTPVRLACDDGNEYVVKSAHAGRMIVTDQIVGRIGIACGAPVGAPALVD